MCTIIIVSLFSISLLQPIEARQNACCEKTTSGQYCVYTALTNCSPPPFNVAPVSCNQAAYCSPICCILPQTGTCSKNVAAAQCTAQGGIIDATDPNCSVSQCQQGCCTIGGQYFLATEIACNLRAANYPNANIAFDPSITNQQSCINQGRQQEEGCCVIGQNVCSYTTLGQCQGTFYGKQYCSDPSFSCGCTAKAEKRCIPGEDDVYWFDSCGNKERVAEVCDYAQGTACQTRNNQVACYSVDCAQTVAMPNNPHDPKITSGGPRKNGETWCSYESGVGNFLDRPGSRHYRHSCLNGKEYVEECRQFREEVCVQSTNAQGLSVGNCLHNEVYDSEITVNVSTVPRGQEFWDGSNEVLCAEATTECTVLWVKRNRFSDWKCMQNCQCETKEHINNMTNYCKARGDCGADINILDEGTATGIVVEWTGSGRGTHPLTVNNLFWKTIGVYGVFGGLIGLRPVVEEIETAGWEVPGILNTKAAYELSIGKIKSFFKNPLKNYFDVFQALYGFVLAVYTLFLLGGGKTETKTITVNCKPWTAPTGGDDCARCSDDPRYQMSNYANPVLCDEYRCKSLGAACEIINPNVPEAVCVAKHPNDPNHPIISPWSQALSEGFTYKETPSGYIIEPTIPAFTPITFGILTDEPAQCKIANKLTGNFEEMVSYFGNAYHTKEHNITLNLPGGQAYDYYVRCADVQGNTNAKEYVIQFTTDPEPDFTPPIIQATSPASGAYVTADINGTAVTLYMNEPSTCLWDDKDATMQNMPPQNTFICDTEVNQNPTFFNLYSCLGALTGVQPGQTSMFYIRCADLVGNEMGNGYPFILEGTTPLQITFVEPIGELLTATPTLQVTTQGGAEQGKAICTFQARSYTPVTFFTTNANVHTQSLGPLGLGSYSYNIACTDIAGNTDTNTISFTITVDDDPPQIVNLYADTSTLYLTTNEPATCAYTEDPNNPPTQTQGTTMRGSGTITHTLPLSGSPYFILCWDLENNIMGPVTVYT